MADLSGWKTRVAMVTAAAGALSVGVGGIRWSIQMDDAPAAIAECAMRTDSLEAALDKARRRACEMHGQFPNNCLLFRGEDE